MSLDPTLNASQVIRSGFKLSKESFFAILPFTFALAFMSMAIQPLATFTLIDYIDMLTFAMFLIGVLVISALLGSIIYRLHSIKLGISVGISESIKKGLALLIPMFIVATLFAGMVVACHYGAVTLVDYFLEIPYIEQLRLESMQGWEYSYTILTNFPAIYLGVYLFYSLFLIALNANKKLGFIGRIRSAFVGSYRLVKGHWWQVACIVFILLFVYSLIDYLCQLVIQEQIVLTSLLAITLQSLFLAFWYALAITLLYSLNENLEKPIKIKTKTNA